ncbi:1-phosphofructokinase family hexose kinase [Corynebacterium pseudotuberculosis]|uniref:Hexose kinase n=1 Tax=Corynebacterium pseudotuberculosis (strain C231) TaxID=681645 RepID=D9QAX7_CORP2|nr:1-phosphofructokinase family hexose kinase [Corynebacterium pseudotuberculosis]ADK29030.1 hexose kinase [Corynebacterium pseudotuberculosis FRC41]ADL10703.1 hexose kinase [Corynebacterium pseudotuberculosis C231]ADL21111.1 1-phosphofructokinase family hexose kinase [Corynebacterium pseudotuberculosis 1002]ADO26502.1 hexose kinase [Corynebacterium pseudotuberculosis I19]AEK92568.1 1-phosphofructokinase [Corynebacterium pseudotuberculosis PAT10]
MILTFTPNPSIDTTLTLDTALQRGSVQRPISNKSVAGGKGVNVSQAIAKAGQETIALFPSATNDPFIELVKQANIPGHAVPVCGHVRVNTAVTEPDGTTTKFNDQGAKLDSTNIETLESELLAFSQRASWVVLSGSLPPGAPINWYSLLVEKLQQKIPGINIAVDTSDKSLVALANDFDKAAPTIIKPNGMELGQLVGVEDIDFEAEAEKGNYEPVVSAAEKLLKQGLEAVLVTLGASGAVLVSAAGAWIAQPPKTTVVSTVGAGDCTLAGFIMGQSSGLSQPESLALGVAYGSAAAALPGTTIPTPDLVDVAGTRVFAFTKIKVS